VGEAVAAEAGRHTRRTAGYLAQEVGAIRQVAERADAQYLTYMHDPRYADPRPDLFGSLLVLVQHLSRRLDEALAPLGLTSRQWLLLAVMERWFSDRSPTLTEAAVRYGTSRQNVKQVALGLERRGYVRLVPDRLDRRATRLELTDKVSIFYQPDLRARRLEILDAVFTDLDPSRVEVLRDLIGDWLAVEERKRARQLLTHHQEG